MRRLALTMAALLLAGCLGGSDGPPDPPLEQGYRLEAVFTGFDSLAQIAFAPDGRMFVTERQAGELRVLENGTLHPRPWARFDVADDGEQGLLGVAVHPDFPRQPWVYAYYTYADGSEFYNRLVRVHADGARETLLDRIPGGIYHDGGALAFDDEGHLWITTGDGHDRSLAQDPDTRAGKILRVTPLGDAVAGNPFGPENPAFTLGHRNSFGIAFDLEGGAWITENGPDRHDEVNHLQAGGNYGWPEVTGRAEEDRFVDPRWVWEDSIAPTGLAFPGDRYPDLVGDLLVGDYLEGHVRHLALDASGDVTGETRLATAPEGIVDVEASPDGQIYVATPHKIYRLVPDG